MFAFLMVVQVLVCLLLIAVILMQSSKGGGLAGTFGGGNVGMVFGVRRTADFLIRATQILAGTFIVLSFLMNVFFLPKTTVERSAIEQGGTPTQQQQQGLPPQSIPSETPPPAPQQ